MILGLSGCGTGPLPPKAVYTQNLGQLFWAENEQSLYAVYLNHEEDNYPNGFRSFLYHIPLKGKPELLYSFDPNFAIPLILDFSAKHKTFFISYYNSYQGIFTLKEGIHTKVTDIDVARQAYLLEDFLVGNAYLKSSNGTYQSKASWGRYKLADLSFMSFAFSPLHFTPEYVHPYQQHVYLANHMPNQNSSEVGQEQHALGKLQLESAKISDIVMIPNYSNGALRFWSWLTEQEVLFSRIDEEANHVESISYHLGSKKYSVRVDFKKKGVLSPQLNYVAYLENNQLMVSKPDGSAPQKILDIESALPKGDPKWL